MQSISLKRYKISAVLLYAGRQYEVEVFIGFHFRLQLLLSSSMDNTVRLWDLETKTCLKIFVHNDYGIRSIIHE